MSEKSNHPLQILCVDDEQLLGETLVQFLSAAGHTAEHVANGLEAWERISREPGRFDVLVTDNRMPGLNGMELVERLRAAGFPGRIVVHSGSLTAAEMDRCRASRVDGVVPKGAELGQLLRVIVGDGV